MIAILALFTIIYFVAANRVSYAFSDDGLKKLYDNNIKTINDIWILKRKDLKDIGLNDKEIKSIVISLQLEGLDLNKKIYD